MSFRLRALFSSKKSVSKKSRVVNVTVPAGRTSFRVAESPSLSMSVAFTNTRKSDQV